MFAPGRGRRLNRPVWVKVGLLFPQVTYPARRRVRPQILDVTGELPGHLHAWYRTGTGDWLGLVSYTILYVDRVPSAGLELQDQLVPADALRPRTFGGSHPR